MYKIQGNLCKISFLVFFIVYLQLYKTKLISTVYNNYSKISKNNTDTANGGLIYVAYSF